QRICLTNKMRFALVALLVVCFTAFALASPAKNKQAPACSPYEVKSKGECGGNVSSARAALIASSANMEQCNLTGGKRNSLAMSVFFNLPASSMVLPFTHSVAKELLAMAEPQPKVLNLASIILPFSSTLICNFITSPQAGAPTKPVPTLLSFLSKEPTLRGFS
ncbi:hypothetical protein DOY81_002858, partial [Sarcophaga bullata]